MAAAASLAALPLARASDDVQAVGVRVTALGLVALVAALVNSWSPLLPVSLLALGGVYAAQLGVDREPLDTASPVFAAGLFVTAELAYWALEERDGVRAEPGEGLRRFALVAGLGLAALFLAAAVLAAVDLVRARGLTVDLLGAAAAAAALLVVLAFARGRDRAA